MEIGRSAIVRNVNVVTADFQVFTMERLADITNELADFYLLEGSTCIDCPQDQ